MEENKKSISLRAQVKNRQLMIPAWMREICGWKPNEILYFRLKGTALEVECTKGYTTKMIKNRIYIPVDLARALNIRDGTVVELIPEEDGRLIIKPVREQA